MTQKIRKLLYVSTLYIFRMRVPQDFDIQSVIASCNRLEHAIAGSIILLYVKRL